MPVWTYKWQLQVPNPEEKNWSTKLLLQFVDSYKILIKECWPKTDQNKYWPPNDHLWSTAEAGVKSTGGFDHTTLLVKDIPSLTFNLNHIQKTKKNTKYQPMTKCIKLKQEKQVHGLV